MCSRPIGNFAANLTIARCDPTPRDATVALPPRRQPLRARAKGGVDDLPKLMYE